VAGAAATATVAAATQATGSVAATVAPPGVQELYFSGPIALVILGLAWGLVIGAVVITVDAIRRPANHYPKPFWRWVWVVPQVVLLAFVLLRVVGGPSASAPVAGLILLWGVVCLVFDVGYLLEVVFPTAAGHAARKGEGSGEDGER
jgi:hypothetical protein